jgi:hypothetical protein
MTDAETAAALDLLTDATTAQTAQAAIAKQALDAAVTEFASTIQAVADIVPDADKAISTLVAQALAEKQVALVSGTTVKTINGESILGSGSLVIERGALEKPTLAYSDVESLRTPSAAPLSGDVVNVPSLGEFQFTSVFEYVDDGEIAFQVVDPSDNVTPIGQWVLVIPAYEWLEAQKMFENAVLWEWMEDEELRFNLRS